MKLDAQLSAPLAEVADQARRFHAAGLDGAFTYEGPSDVLFPLVIAAEHTPLDLYTNVAIAFPRNPMQLAYQAWDLQRLSGGRFALGLGTQIRTHIERRYGIAWERPVDKMRELLGTLRAIWACWADGVPLDVQGEFYHHTLMPPTFVPRPLDHGPPPLWVGAVGPRLTRMVAEVADGLVTHPFTSADFLAAHTVPLVEEGLAVGGRTRDALTLGIGAIVAVYETDEQRARAEQGCRGLLGFYGSTPAYRGVLDVHGWGDLQPRLRELTRSGNWGDLGAVWTDEQLDTLTVRGTPAEVADELHRRFGGVADRICLSTPYAVDDALLADLAAAVHAPR